MNDHYDMSKYIVPRGTLVWIYDAQTKESYQMKTAKDLHYSEKDWETFWNDHDLADEIKIRVAREHRLSGSYTDLDIVDLPKNDRGWTHLLYLNDDVQHDQI